MQYTINQLKKEIKELEEMMMCLTSTVAIHRMIIKRDKLEETLGSFIRINKLYISNKSRMVGRQF